MRTLLVLVLIVAGGCSWATARAPNSNPRVGCSRTPGRMDVGLALAGVGGIIALLANIAADPPGEGDHNRRGAMTSLGVSVLAGFSLLEVLQGAYGLSVADRCQAERSKLSAPPPMQGPPGMSMGGT